MGGGRAQQGPLHLDVYGELKRAVISGELPPGTVLSEAELARRWSMSRTPVREALRQLELDDLITWAPRRGATVAGITVAGLRDLFELRECLEGMASRLAAERAQPSDVEELKALLGRIDAAHCEGDIPLTIELDDAFHRRIAFASGNRLLASAADRPFDRFRVARALARHVPGRLESFRQEHEEILAAIAARDPEGAERAIVLHVRRSRARLSELLERGEANHSVSY